MFIIKPIHLILFFIGFANSVVLPITGSVLSIWLTEEGVAKSTIGLMTLFTIPFSLRILFVPIIDLTALPGCRHLPRKSWVIFTLLGMMGSIGIMCFGNPSLSLTPIIIGLFFLSLFSGCFHMVGLSYELESQESSEYSVGSAFLLMGYRIGLLAGGAGVLYLSAFLSWNAALYIMMGILFVGALTIVFYPEPFKSEQVISERKIKFGEYSSRRKAYLHEITMQPLKAFFQNPQWLGVLGLLLIFKLGDQIIQGMVGPFYLSQGLSKIDVANATKLWGMAATLLGAAAGGYLVKGKNPFVSLAQMGILHAFSLLSYWFLAVFGISTFGLYLTISLEHLTGGMAMTAFISFLWHNCKSDYAAIQYTLFFSLFSLKGDFLACIGGILASATSWGGFFAIAAVASITCSLGAFLLLKVKTPSPTT